MKINVQRLVKVWVVDTYNVDEINDQTIQEAIDYENDDCLESDTLWETLEDLGPVDVYDESMQKLLYSKGYEDG